jgi:hypothetical protein
LARHRENHSNPSAAGILTKSAAIAAGTNPAGAQGGVVAPLAAQRHIGGRAAAVGRGGATLSEVVRFVLDLGCDEPHRTEGT